MGISNEAKAFILVICAGLCTTIGASVVFFPQLANLANRTTLAVSLGLAAGVMLYISLVDIYSKSIDGFAEVHDEDRAFIYATLSYFGGCFLMLFLDKCVHWLLEWEMQQHAAKGEDDAALEVVASMIACCAPNPGEELDKLREDFASRLAAEKEAELKKTGKFCSGGEDGTKDLPDDKANATQHDTTETASDSILDTTKHVNAKPLRQMGFAMALAIAIHNFPEGMVTYVAYVQEPAVGVALAIGIAIHNIPEGLCVSMPLFYATGRRWYSFAWGTLSGLTEPIGALIAWLVIGAGLGGNANGILFGIVAGMMTVISVHELLPNAHRYAINDSTVTYSFLVGSFLIALSLMLFSV